ncbi:MAG: hypothetical protein KDK99_00025, partial [Verrucomicrobiales bacterium]|nr:hypothetical protein [Verrucomicrobiales bacterium]
MKIRIYLFAVALVGGWSSLGAAEPVPEKAARYLQLLTKRPQPGSVFERFVTEWLAEGSLEGLRAYLEERAAAASATTADRLLLGFYYARQNESEKSLETFRTALEADPENEAVWLLRAKAEARMLDFDAALKSLEKVSSEGTAEAAREAALLRARLLARSGESVRALEVIGQLAERFQEDEALQDGLLELQISEGLLAEGIGFAESMLKRTTDPYRRIQRRLRLGDLYQRADRSSDAVAAYDQCLDDAAQDSWVETEVLAQMDRIFRRKDDVAGLAEHLKKLAQENPARAAVGQARATVLVELGQGDEAVEAYQGLLEKQPGNAVLLDGYVDLLVRLDRAKDAVEVLRPLADERAGDREAQFRLIALLPQAGQPGEATKRMEEMLAKEEASELDFLRVARLYEAMEDPKEARRTYQRAAEKFADSESAQDALASFLHSNNERTAALRIWRERAAKADADGVLRVARALAARGEHEAALEVMEACKAPPADDTAWLTLKTTSAIGAKRTKLAADLVREVLRRADRADALDAALRLARQVFHPEEDVTRTLMEELRSMPEISAPERCLLADVLEGQGDLKGADAALQGAQGEGQALVARFHARLLERRYHFEAAVEKAREAIAAGDNRNADDLAFLVQLLSRIGDNAEALKTVAQWKAAAPASNRPWLEEARLLRLDDRPEAAVEVLRQAMRRFEGETAVADALAGAYGAAEKWADAQRIETQLFEDAEELAAKLGRVRKMAAAAQQRGALSALVEDMELRHQENPNSVVPLLALAEVHRYTNNYEKRRQAMMEAARLRPKDAKLLQQIAEIEVGEGDWRAAVMTLEQAMKLTQDPAPLQQQVAGLHLRFGEPETGLRMMVKLAGGAEMKAREAEQMAVTMMEAGYWAEAQDMLRLVLTRQAEDFRLRTLLGLTLMEAGDFSQAATEFAALLGARVELAEPVANPRPSIAEEMEKRSSVGGTLPPALVELYPISMAVYQASSSQRIGQRNGNGFNPGQSQTAYLPDTVADAAPFGVAYLLIAASRGDEAVRQQVEEELTAAQVRPEGLLEKFEVAPNGGLIPRSDRFDEFYQDPVYAAAMTQSPTGNRTGTVNEDQMRRLVQHYRTEYPAMAAQAAYALLKQDAQAHADQVEVLTSVVDSAKTDEWWWGAYLLGLLGNETAGSVSSEDQKKLLTCSRDWLARRRAFKDAKVRNIANYLDQLELAMLVKERDWAKLVARMQEMAAGDRNDNEASRYTSYYYGSQRIEIEPLDFPGRHAQKLVPPTILQILAAVTSGQMGEFSPADREALAVALDGGGDDRLRLGGLLLLEDEARYKPRLEKAAEAADASYDVLALAAAKATQDGKTEQAFSLLLRARDRADSMDDRGEAEGALVAAALALREQGVETVLKNHGEAVQSALLQLRHAIAASGNVSGMNELAEAMEHFDLGTEAASLRKLLASQQSAQKQMAATQGDRDPDDMEKLLKAGDKTAAVAMAVTELRRLADDILNGRNSGSRYEISNWAETLEEHHLVKDLLQASAPANAATSYRVYAEHALICSWLKDWDGAKKALEYCLEQRSRDPVLRMRMVGVILANGGDLKEALEQWQKIPERDRDQAMSEWIEELDQWEDVSVRLALGRFFIATLQQSGDESQGPMSQYPTYWQSAALNLMVEDCSEGSTWRPHVRVRPEVLKRLAKSRGKNFLPEVKEREKVAVELAELIVQRGELGSAGSAFDLLATLGLRDADEKRLKQLDEMAEALLQRGLKSDQRFRGMGYRMSSWSSSDSDFLDPVTLPFYVMLRRWSAGKPLAEDDPWFRDLASLEGPESAQWYRQSAVLFTAPEADWMTAALEAQSKLQSRANRFSNLPPLPLEVWRRRGLKISPAPIAKQIIEEQLRQGNWVDVGPFVALFDSVQQRCDPAETERFLQDCAAAFMGVPWEKAADFVSKHANPEQNGSQGSPVWRVDRFWTFCDELMDEISRIPPTVRVLFALGYNNTGYRFSRLFDYDALQPDQVEPLIAVLRDLQILADLPDLKFWFSQGNSREPLIRILASAFEITEENKGSASKQWRKVLEKENTFAATLVNQACKNSRTNTDWELLKPYVNVLSGLHEERVREVILAINTIFYPPYSRLSLSNREYLGPEMQPFW